MKDQIVLLLAGSAVPLIASYLVSLWKKNAPAIEEALDTVDEKLEARFDIDIPDPFQSLLHNIVHGAVSYVNKFAGDARFWREVLRAVMTKDFSKAALLQREIASLSWDRGIACVESMLSPELKEIVNEVKETLAFNTIKANLVAAGVADVPMVSAPVEPGQPRKFVPIQDAQADQEIRAAIRVVAPAHKPIEGPVTREMIERMIIESQERQAKLAAKK